MVNFNGIANIGIFIRATFYGGFFILTASVKGDKPDFRDEVFRGKQNENLDRIFRFSHHLEEGIEEDGASFKEVLVLITDGGILGLEAEHKFAGELHFHGQFLNLDSNPLLVWPLGLRRRIHHC